MPSVAERITLNKLKSYANVKRREKSEGHWRIQWGCEGCERTSPKFRSSAFTKNTDKYQGLVLNIIPLHYPPVQGVIPPHICSSLRIERNPGGKW